MSDNPKRVSGDDRLMISYTIRHRNQILEASAPDESIEYRMGVGIWPPQLELAMLGELVGKRLKITLKAGDHAFGQTDPERIIQMDKVDFPTEPEPGELIEFEFENKEPVEGQVLSVFGDKIQVDFNHPYAGRDLNIEIHIKSIL